MLEAVNELLSTVRLSRVMSLLPDSLNEDAAEALQCLNDASREVQIVGWEFNTEPGAVLDPSTAGEVSLPANTLKARSVRCRSGQKLTRRGNRLYSASKRTYAIGEAVTVDLVIALPFEELPPGAKNYVVALAASKYAPPRLPSSGTFRYTDDYLASALIAMEQEDSEGRLDSLPETSPHFAAMARR